MTPSVQPTSRARRRRSGQPVLRRGLAVTLTELRCAAVTAALLLGRRLVLPAPTVGRRVRFGDGTESTVYRETRRLGARADEPVLLVVIFRLRLLGVNPFAHALFRAESLLNTPLFAGQPGFCSKLWLTDRTTGFYRGIYEWDGVESARRYGETLRVVLRPYAQRASFGYEILQGLTRDDFLDGTADSGPGEGADRWWATVPPSPVDEDRR